ncbi:uncharacterized [Tachysurus ichikawai]
MTEQLEWIYPDYPSDLCKFDMDKDCVSVSQVGSAKTNITFDHGAPSLAYTALEGDVLYRQGKLDVQASVRPTVQSYRADDTPLGPFSMQAYASLYE